MNFVAFLTKKKFMAKSVEYAQDCLSDAVHKKIKFETKLSGQENQILRLLTAQYYFHTRLLKYYIILP